MILITPLVFFFFFVSKVHNGTFFSGPRYNLRVRMGFNGLEVCFEF
jgi:hypothetical protein